MKPEDVLRKLIPAILEIDGGCSGCIASFCDAANKALADYGFVYRFIEKDEEGGGEIYPGIVEVISVGTKEEEGIDA